MPENEIPAAEEAPVTEEVTEEATVEVAEEAPEETTAPDGVPVQMTMDAADLLGDESQPAEAADSRASELKAVLEAVVYVMNEPMPAAQIAEALGRDKKEVEEALRQLVEETAQPGRGLFIREVGGGFQMATKAEHHEAIRQFVKNLKQPLKLSQAALETLAVIAYKQPITLPEILEIRGVQGGGVLKTLIDRKLVTTAGRKQVIGRPMLYKTTKDFLTQFGLKDVNELPSLKEFEEIRRQSMADDEFTQAAPEPNEPSPAVVEENALEAEAANEESGSPEPAGEVSGSEVPTSDGAGADQSEEGPNG
jgi:segregation and condensation protein B